MLTQLLDNLDSAIALTVPKPATYEISFDLVDSKLLFGWASQNDWEVSEL